MGVWIRSQNKEVLRHCSKMQYFKTKSSHLVVDANTGEDNVTILGKYPTRERAIEVLDEIGKFIEYGTSSSWETNIETRHGYFVYQMPSE